MKKLTRAERWENLEQNIYNAYNTIEAIRADFEGCYNEADAARIEGGILSLERAIIHKGGFGGLLIKDLDSMEQFLTECNERADALYCKAENASVAACRA